MGISTLNHSSHKSSLRDNQNGKERGEMFNAAEINDRKEASREITQLIDTIMVTVLSGSGADIILLR